MSSKTVDYSNASSEDKVVKSADSQTQHMNSDIKAAPAPSGAKKSRIVQIHEFAAEAMSLLMDEDNFPRKKIMGLIQRILDVSALAEIISIGPNDLDAENFEKLRKFLETTAKVDLLSDGTRSATLRVGMSAGFCSSNDMYRQMEEDGVPPDEIYPAETRSAKPPVLHLTRDGIVSPSSQVRSTDANVPNHAQDQEAIPDLKLDSPNADGFKPVQKKKKKAKKGKETSTDEDKEEKKVENPEKVEKVEKVEKAKKDKKPSVTVPREDREEKKIEVTPVEVTPVEVKKVETNGVKNVVAPPFVSKKKKPIPPPVYSNEVKVRSNEDFYSDEEEEFDEDNFVDEEIDVTELAEELIIGEEEEYDEFEEVETDIGKPIDLPPDFDAKKLLWKTPKHQTARRIGSYPTLSESAKKAQEERKISKRERNRFASVVVPNKRVGGTMEWSQPLAKPYTPRPLPEGLFGTDNQAVMAVYKNLANKMAA